MTVALIGNLVGHTGGSKRLQCDFLFFHGSIPSPPSEKDRSGARLGSRFGQVIASGNGRGLESAMGIGVAGEVLVLLLANLGLADGVAAVFRLSIFQAFFFSRPHPSFQAIFEVVTGCQDVSEMGPWDESNLRLLLTSLTVFARSSKHPMSPVRFTDFVRQPHKTCGHRHDVVVCSDGGSGG